MNLKFGEKKTTKTENKASHSSVSEEKTVNRASLLREGDRIAVEGVSVEGVPSLASTCGGGYFKVYHFMTKELGLGGAKLLVYALIYSFTVSEGSFFGSRGYMAEACGMSVKTVDRTLRELVNIGLLSRGEATHLESIEYKANISPQTEGESQNDAPSKMSHLESQKVPPLWSECLTRGDKVTHNNKDYNKTNIHTNIHTTTCALTREEITEEGNKNEGVYSPRVTRSDI